MLSKIVIAAFASLIAVGVTGWTNHSSREHLRGQRDAALAQVTAAQRQTTSAFTETRAQGTPKMPYAGE